ncbi:pancreatic lipase-related protein 3-like isoform X2 [Agrilus planipennis]|uniref:Pancreatic lipase-related protein 3-like isoform X2 n=1 Tax=Agrilus planipennis TaxID=224129 RepID=A0A1W4XLK1_AGRPL|nr:pancreatic lipase-related protein 3-like isoform X2 [Agrilus planipennis]
MNFVFVKLYLIVAYLAKLCRKLGRITGLDAAGPLFCFKNLVDKDKRINADDAEFVDAIHSNGGVFGCLYNYGTADFRPNCGTQQSDCLVETNKRNGSFIDKFINDSYCNHYSSTTYYVQSIYDKNKFLANKCASCDNYRKHIYDTTSNSSEEYMGEYCSKHASGNYYLSTNNLND